MSKSAFKVKEMLWQEKGSSVKMLKTRSLIGYTAFNEKPASICIQVSGPDDRGVNKDIVIDIASLLKDLEKHNLLTKVG